MSAYAQLYADTQDHREQIYALRRELQMAAARFNALAKNAEPGAFRDLYTRWADETRQAAENA